MLLCNNSVGGGGKRSFLSLDLSFTLTLVDMLVQDPAPYEGGNIIVMWRS